MMALPSHAWQPLQQMILCLSDSLYYTCKAISLEWWFGQAGAWYSAGDTLTLRQLVGL